MSKEHSYTNGEVTIIWRSDLCIHSRKCWKGLAEVFKPGQRPWIQPEGASTERIVAQVKECPSGALTFRMNAGADPDKEDAAPATEVEVSANGPLLVKGSCSVIHPDGRKEMREKVTAFCRCGASANKPYCDGSHRRIGFNDQSAG
ncbi:MAG TPA: (4Fe-4S)-binding protein [Flavobacteriales bacterium]|nr:(4Fe-4S)-binding protein [Flavobacteriales bacterium]HNU55138.1 (4Fe-4S)-binding protein [Flavobacteriales bacterium]